MVAQDLQSHERRDQPSTPSVIYSPLVSGHLQDIDAPGTIAGVTRTRKVSISSIFQESAPRRPA